MNTFRILLSVATNLGWTLSQMNVKNTFLQGTLDEEVYMTLLPDHKNVSNSSLVCKLKKAIYGLKQSPRAWYAKLSLSLLKINFVKSSADSSMFVKHSQNFTIIILVYIDDVIIIENSNEKIEKVKKYLKKEFDIKDLGQLSYFLGVEIATSSKGLFLSQQKYVLDLLKETEKLGLKPAGTPMETNVKLGTNNGEPLPNIEQYQRLVGKLIYLTVTRLDITFAVSMVSQFMHAPCIGHLNVIDRILRYLKGTSGQGI
jgi:Reverse transcriptase (RNA-dependent DNA polymerase)